MLNFKKYLFLLSTIERRNAAFLLLMIIFMALLDMIGVASILPFMAVLTNPSLIETNMFLNKLYALSSIFKVDSKDEFLFVLGILVFFLLILSLTFKAFTTYFQVRFVQMREYSIGKRLIEGYLHQPYSWFLSRHSSDLGKNILSEVQQIITNGLRPLMELIAKIIISITLITLLIIVDYKLAIIVGLSLSFIYSFIFYFVRKYLNLSGKKRLINNKLRFIAVNEALGASKEVKVGGLEKVYINNFSSSAKIFAETQAFSIIIGQLPRFILEAIAFGGVLLIILYVMTKTGSFNNALPVISLYVFAGYRLMPALQQIYRSIAQLTFVSYSLNKIYSDLQGLKKTNETKPQEVLTFEKSITLNNISYNYPNSSRTALNDINFSIPIKSTIGLVGKTGSGKTTTIDIILGLLEPQKGTLKVDEKIITKQNSRSWQSFLGYVPQNIYLSDDTILANIAFGVNPEKIDQSLVEKASKIANLHNFVVNELPNRYLTTIGERGVRLSGGQRQRIGIARALYNNPKVLILDEATSALDTKTEKEVMEAINKLRKDITIIIITHRLATVSKCDKIFLLESGKLKNQGTFEELLHSEKMQY